MKLWLDSDNQQLKPPKVTTLSGKSKKNREKDKDEPRKKYGKCEKTGIHMTSRLCNQVEHNKKICSRRMSQGTEVFSMTFK